MTWSMPRVVPGWSGYQCCIYSARCILRRRPRASRICSHANCAVPDLDHKLCTQARATANSDMMMLRNNRRLAYTMLSHVHRSLHQALLSLQREERQQRSCAENL